MDKNIVKGTLSHPIVFNAVFEEPKFCANFLNSTGLFNIDENSIKVENTKGNDGIDLITSDMDVKIKIENNLYINLEMQNRNTKYDMMLRLSYYLGKLISRSQPKGSGYIKNYSVVFAIFNFTLFKDNDYIREFKLKDDNGNEIEYIKIIVLELTKKARCDKKELREWLDTFNKKDLNDIKENQGIMSELKDKIIALNQDEELLARLDSYEKQQRDYIANMESYKQEGLEEGRKVGLEEGRKEGRKEGLQQGLQQGLEQGLQQGLEQGLEQGYKEANLENAKKLKELGVSIDIIVEATNLDRETIEKL